MGVLVLSLVEPLDRDLQLSDAADTLGLALTELERIRRELECLRLPGEPGRVPLDDVSGYRAGIDSLLYAAAGEITRMRVPLPSPIGTFCTLWLDTDERCSAERGACGRCGPPSTPTSETL